MVAASRIFLSLATMCVAHKVGARILFHRGMELTPYCPPSPPVVVISTITGPTLPFPIADDVATGKHGEDPLPSFLVLREETFLY